MGCGSDADALGPRFSGRRTLPLATTLKPSKDSATPFGESLVIANGRTAEVVAFERQVVDFFVSAAELLGVPKSVAAIYGIVFASPTPLSFADIEERLDISKGSISQGLRVLREVGALKEVSTAADRAELFTPDLELRKLVARFIENRLERQLTAGTSRLAMLQKGMPRRSAAENELISSRIDALQTWHRKARTVVPLVRTILKVDV